MYEVKDLLNKRELPDPFYGIFRDGELICTSDNIDHMNHICEVLNSV